MEKITFTTAKTREDIAKIIELQRKNQIRNLDEATMKSEGFVTFEYEIEPLFAMNQSHPSVVAWAEDGRLAGYCISACSADRGYFEVLDRTYDYFEALEFCGKKLSDQPMMLTGQICVAEGFRGLCVFEGLYAKFQAIWSPGFEFCVTEISKKNTRSLRAHERIGFEVFHEFSDEILNETWVVVGWDWRKVPLKSSKID